MPKGLVEKIRGFLKEGPERLQYAQAFKNHLHSQARVMQRIGGAICSVVWLGYAFDTDPKLHPEFPGLIYFRLGLSVVALVVLFWSFIEKLRGKGLGLIYVLAFYAQLTCSFFTGRIAYDANYVAGLQLVTLLLVLIPFPRRVLFSLYAFSIAIFVGSVFYHRPDLSTASAKYSMNNLAVAYVFGIVMGYFLNRFRFEIFLNQIRIAQKNLEVQEQMEKVHALKVQQDGDYFLTSILLRPLATNTAKSNKLTVEFLINQKKKFEFRRWQSEIGGDLCTAHTIHLSGREYTVFLNGDAMGKSLQGASGALVLGTVFKSIVSRTQASSGAQRRYPEQWLKECFIDLQNVFVPFDGSMLISAVIGLVDNETGFLYFINAEHPWLVLYRDGKASFMEDTLSLRKIGTAGHEGSLRIHTFQMRPHDVVIVGSDGRDDLLLGMDEKGRVINEDESLFVRTINESGTDLPGIEGALQTKGELTDDLSLLRVAFMEDHPHEESRRPARAGELYESARTLMRGNKKSEAMELLEECVRLDPLHAEAVRLLARVCLNGKDFEKAALYCERYTVLNPGNNAFLYYTSHAYKRSAQGDMEKLSVAADFGERCRLRDPSFVENLLNLSDTYRLMHNAPRSTMIAELAIRIEPENERARRLAGLSAAEGAPSR